MSRRTRASAAKKKEAPPAPKIEEPVPGPAPSPTPEEQAQPPARPRRRREQSEASAFLSKTYAMISALDGVVGGWSKNGDTMVIFDSEKFAAEIIPQYFKHNNFRSFVRQLNFYGFRKLRADANAGPAAQARWEFKHPNFRRGRHDLLVLIRRAEHYDHGSYCGVLESRPSTPFLHVDGVEQRRVATPSLSPRHRTTQAAPTRRRSARGRPNSSARSRTCGPRSRT